MFCFDLTMENNEKTLIFACVSLVTFYRWIKTFLFSLARIGLIDFSRIWGGNFNQTIQRFWIKGVYLTVRYRKETMLLSKNLKDLMEKVQNPKIFWNRSRIGAPSSLESSMKQKDLTRIKTNQSKWKSMTVLIFLHLKPKTLLYQAEFLIYIKLKCPNS